MTLSPPSSFFSELFQTTPGHAAGKAGAAELRHGGSDRCLALSRAAGRWTSVEPEKMAMAIVLGRQFFWGEYDDKHYYGIMDDNGTI